MSEGMLGVGACVYNLLSFSNASLGSYTISFLVTNEFRRSRMKTAEMDESTCLRAELVSLCCYGP